MRYRTPYAISYGTNTLRPDQYIFIHSHPFPSISSIFIHFHSMTLTCENLKVRPTDRPIHRDWWLVQEMLPHLRNQRHLVVKSLYGPQCVLKIPLSDDACNLSRVPYGSQHLGRKVDWRELHPSKLPQSPPDPQLLTSHMTPTGLPESQSAPTPPFSVGTPARPPPPPGWWGQSQPAGLGSSGTRGSPPLSWSTPLLQTGCGFDIL